MTPHIFSELDEGSPHSGEGLEMHLELAVHSGRRHCCPPVVLGRRGGGDGRGWPCGCFDLDVAQLVDGGEGKDDHGWQMETDELEMLAVGKVSRADDFGIEPEEGDEVETRRELPDAAADDDGGEGLGELDGEAEVDSGSEVEGALMVPESVELSLSDPFGPEEECESGGGGGGEEGEEEGEERERDVRHGADGKEVCLVVQLGNSETATDPD